MPINFPDNPTNGQEFTSGATTWTYNGTAWDLKTTTTASNDSMPVGSIMWFAGSTAPTGWVLCNGATYTNSTYPNLVAVIGTTFGGTPGTNFMVPNINATTGAYYIRFTTAVGVTSTLSLLSAPAGSMVQWPVTSSYPTGWLRCDGSNISRTSYADLFALIGTTYGTGDGSTTFTLPNISAAGTGSPVYIIKATTSGLIEPSTVAHAASHVRGGTDVIDVDRGQIDFVPLRYTRDSSPAQAGAVTDLTAHLKGIDTLAGQGHIVCTSSTRPSSPTIGTMIYETDTGYVVVYNGISWVQMMAPATPPAIVLINPTSVTGGTVSNGVVSFSNTAQVFVNGVFSNQFRNYRVLFNGTNTSAGIGNIRWRWRSAGADYDNNYYNRMWYQHNNVFTTVAGDNTIHSEWLYVANISAYASFDVFDPFLFAPSGYTAHHQAWGTSNNLVGETHSWQYVNRSYDGFSMNPMGGNMTGTIRVYGIRDSI